MIAIPHKRERLRTPSQTRRIRATELKRHLSSLECLEGMLDDPESAVTLIKALCSRPRWNAHPPYQIAGIFAMNARNVAESLAAAAAELACQAHPPEALS